MLINSKTVIFDVGKSKYKPTKDDAPEFLKGSLGVWHRIPGPIDSSRNNLNRQIKRFKESRMLGGE